MGGGGPSAKGGDDRGVAHCSQPFFSKLSGGGQGAGTGRKGAVCVEEVGSKDSQGGRKWEKYEKKIMHHCMVKVKSHTSQGGSRSQSFLSRFL